MERVIIFHTLEHLLAAFRAAGELHCMLPLKTPDGATSYLGVGYIKAMLEIAEKEFPHVPFRLVVDCGEDPVHAIAALRCGFMYICVDPGLSSYAALASIAQKHAATLVAKPLQKLDLQMVKDPYQASYALLADRKD